MSNKVETLGKVVQQIVGELHHLKDLSIGTMELVKRLPDYQVALDKLTEEHGKEKDTDGAPTGDSGLVITDE